MRKAVAAGWRLLVWLVPISLLAPIAAGVGALIRSAPYSGNPLGQISIFFTLLAIGALCLVLIATVIAAVFAIKGRPVVALVVLGGVAALMLPAAFLPGVLWYPLAWLVALPGAVAFVVALLGLPELRRTHRALAAATVVLLMLPVVTFGGVRAYVAVNNARQCPAGPQIDLKISGLESGQFSHACGLPLDYPELTGCRDPDATVGLMTGDGIWFLEFQASGPGTVTSDKSPNAAPRLFVDSSTTYGGPFGWQGYYRVDAPCRGYVDAQLKTSDPGSAATVHVKGIWETPLI